jgi:hypothetical protein
MLIIFPEPALGWIERSDHTGRQDLGGVGDEGKTNDLFCEFCFEINVFKKRHISPAIFILFLNALLPFYVHLSAL